MMKSVARGSVAVFLACAGLLISFGVYSADDKSWCQVVADPVGDNEPTAPDGTSIDISSNDTTLAVRVTLASDVITNDSNWYRVTFDDANGGGAWYVDMETSDSYASRFELNRSAGALSQVPVLEHLVGNINGPNIEVRVPLGAEGLPWGTYAITGSLRHRVVDQPGLSVQPFADDMGTGEYTTGNQCAQADLASAQGTGQAPFLAYFDASRSFGGPEIEGYLFDFGDGSPQLVADQPFVEHVYASAGSFTATVNAMHANGQKSAAARAPIIVDAPSTSGGGMGCFGLTLVALGLWRRRSQQG